MSVARITRQQFLDDVTDSVGQVFLSHPLKCARCHDHKFDPIPTKDFYRIQAVFATTHFADRELPFREYETLAGFEEKEIMEKRKAYFADMQDRLTEKSNQALKVVRGQGKKGRALNVGIEGAKRVGGMNRRNR